MPPKAALNTDHDLSLLVLTAVASWLSRFGCGSAAKAQMCVVLSRCAVFMLLARRVGEPPFPLALTGCAEGRVHAVGPDHV